MAVRSSEYVLDELLCFLSNPLFQVPVLSFMENSCLIFDTSSEDSPEYREIHNQYRKLVDSLLEAYRVDTGLSHDDIIKAMKDLNAKPELRKMFQELFEQVLAMDDFTIFVHLMINKNLELQKQALMLITMMQGQLPSSLQQGGSSPRMSTAPSSQQDEDEILRAVLEESKREYEAQQRQNRKEEDDYKAVVNISHVEAKRLDDAHKQEQDKLSEVLKSTMRIGDGPSPSASPGVAGGLAAMGALPALPKDVSKPVQAPAFSKSPAPAAVAAVSAPVVNKPPAAAATAPSKPVPMVAVHGLAPVPGANKSQNSKDAAADWLKTAENEVKTSDAHSKAVYAAAASMAGMSEDEYKQRVNFLKQQRDKLMEMKRREREKQLLTAESSQPTRPASARAARNAMSRKEVPSEPAEPTEEEKKLAMRRAIANRIKSELMGYHDEISTAEGLRTSTLMNFRQRIAWLAVISFLSASFGFVYYIFEINDNFNAAALQHVQTFHTGEMNEEGKWRIGRHMTDIPLAVWLLIFLLPYLQIFGMLLAWTRADPWRSAAFQWPGIVSHRWRKLYARLTGHDRHKAVNSSSVMLNGHTVIDA